MDMEPPHHLKIGRHVFAGNNKILPKWQAFYSREKPWIIHFNTLLRSIWKASYWDGGQVVDHAGAGDWTGL